MAAAKAVKVQYESQPDTGEGRDPSRDRSARGRGRESRGVRDEAYERDEPRRRSRRTRDRSFADMPARMSFDLPRIGFAWAQANTRFWMGTADVLGRMMLNFNERMLGGMAGSTATRDERDGRDDFDDELDDDFDDEFEDDEVRASSRGSGRTRRRASGAGSSTMVDDLTTAIRDGSDVMVQAAEEFDRAFRGTASEQRESRAAEDERRARARRRRAEREVEDADEDLRAARAERADAQGGSGETQVRAEVTTDPTGRRRSEPTE